MAGNEIEIAKYLFNNINKISLKHLGLVEEVGAPKAFGGYTVIRNIDDINLVATQNSSKKADIYVNGKGISLKQSGSSFSFNRLQRAELLKLFVLLEFSQPALTLDRIDAEVDNF